MNDLSKSLKILVDRYPGTMAELARQAQIDRSSLYKIMDGKRMPNRAQLQRLIHALGLNARQAEHLTTQYDELRSGAQAHRTDEALYELLQTAMRSRDNLMNDVLAPMPRSEADLEAAFTSRCYQGYQAVTQQLHLLLTRYLRSEEKRPLMLSPFVGERALSSILIGAFSMHRKISSATCAPCPGRCLFWSCAQCSTRHGFPVRLLPGRCPVC